MRPGRHAGIPHGRHPNWPLAEAVLAGVLPGSTGFDPDDIVGLSPDSWTPVQIDGRPPPDTARELLPYIEPVLAGVLVIVTDDSYAHGAGPFFIHATRFAAFWDTYHETYDSYPFFGDLVVVAPRRGKVVVVHHNGLVATLDGEPCDLL